jgi:hypothetical protein
MAAYEIVRSDDEAASDVGNTEYPPETLKRHGDVQESWPRLLLKICNLAVPTAIGNAFEYLPVCFAMMIVGH